MELLLDAGEALEIFGDSKLVISQLTEEYKCESESLFPLWMQCRELMAQFRAVAVFAVAGLAAVIAAVDDFLVAATVTFSGGFFFFIIVILI
ncbi:hypothetical protein QYE76_045750 [Lolium multiflorum]|uniref:RNase H type-1 domain-containing protein n=1 Tax=Lolium multiflorum TaxID=4521 RepID=A0AAD8WXR7_LOLMU|nr:hypothetical protein QYE76_045750 [Lolium multiflorum]